MDNINEDIKIKITREELAHMKEQLVELRAQEKEIIVAIEEARSHGDLSENSEYHAAKEEQSRTANAIAEIEYIINNHDIVKPTTIQIQNLETEEIEEYVVVGSVGSDVLNNKISDKCPMALAVLNAQINEIVTVQAPKPYRVKVLNISK